MQTKQKVTLYLPPELHRRLKIGAAVSGEAMSAIAQKAIVFYLEHADVVDEVEASHGRTHQVYHCPECETGVVLKKGELVSLGDRPGILEEDLPVEAIGSVRSQLDRPGEELVLAP